jgi:predicted Zn-dependent protease
MKGFLRTVLLVTLLPGTAAAQNAPLPDMDAIARALGVTCDYCHVRGTEVPESSAAAARTRQQIARDMIEMTRALNATVQKATGRSTGVTEVHCVTCHRGVAIPKQLSDIVLQTTVQQGGAAAADQYRELRRRYYGGQSYDFSEAELLRALQRLVDARPTDAIVLLEMNLEFHPQSATSHVLLAQAYLRRRDPEAAIRSLEKALELDPSNGFARGRLTQLLEDRRRRTPQ